MNSNICYFNKMKKTIAITIDFELVEKLKQEKNYSQLINKLIDEYYALTALNQKRDSLTKEQLEEMLVIAERKEELKKQLEDTEREFNERLGLD